MFTLWFAAFLRLQDRRRVSYEIRQGDDTKSIGSLAGRSQCSEVAVAVLSVAVLSVLRPWLSEAAVERQSSFSPPAHGAQLPRFAPRQNRPELRIVSFHIVSDQRANFFL